MKIPGFQDSRISGFQDSRIPRSKDSRIPAFQDSRIPKFQDSRFRESKISGFQDPKSVVVLLSWRVKRLEGCKAYRLVRWRMHGLYGRVGVCVRISLRLCPRDRGRRCTSPLACVNCSARPIVQWLKLTGLNSLCTNGSDTCPFPSPSPCPSPFPFFPFPFAFPFPFPFPSSRFYLFFAWFLLGVHLFSWLLMCVSMFFYWDFIWFPRGFTLLPMVLLDVYSVLLGVYLGLT